MRKHLEDRRLAVITSRIALVVSEVGIRPPPPVVSISWHMERRRERQRESVKLCLWRKSWLENVTSWRSLSEVRCQGARGCAVCISRRRHHQFHLVFMHLPFTWLNAWFSWSSLAMVFRDESTGPWMAWIRRISMSAEGKTWTNF